MLRMTITNGLDLRLGRVVPSAKSASMGQWPCDNSHSPEGTIFILVVWECVGPSAGGPHLCIVRNGQSFRFVLVLAS